MKIPLGRFFDALRTDSRQSARRILRAPILSAIVVATLALAIAANITIFSLLKPTILHKLPSPWADALVAIDATDAKSGAYSSIHITALEHLDETRQTFATIAAYTSSVVRIDTDDSSFDAGVEGVTSDYFAVLGASMRTGRPIMKTDEPLAAVAVISHRLASRMFGDADPLGKTIKVDGRPVSIIGVTAEEFIGVRMDGGDDLFLPVALLRVIQGADPKAMPRVQQIIGKLAPGASVDSARAHVLARWPAIQQAIKDSVPVAQHAAVDNQRLSVGSFAHGFSSLRERYGNSLLFLMLLAGTLLLVGCVNLSGLLLAHGLTRQHEFAVRLALGAGHGRLIRQTLLEGIVLSFAALALALPIARWAGATLTAMISISRALPIGQTTADASVIAIAALVTLVVGIVIGILPARRAVAGRTDDMLRGRGTTRATMMTTRVMLVAQVALSTMLAVSAGLFAETLGNLYANDLQTRSEPVLFTRIAREPLQRTTVLPADFYRGLQDKLASIPLARRASMSTFYPAYMNFFTGILMATVTADEGGSAQALPDHVTPGFFDTYSISLIRGRDFTWNDTDQSPKVAIVNQTLARALSPDGDVIGRHVTVSTGPVNDKVQIVGVVADATVTNIRERHVGGLYRPMMQEIARAQNPMVHLRVSGDTEAAQRAYVDTINATGAYFVRAMFTMEAWIDYAVVEQRLIAGTAGLAAVLALALGAVGLFGLLAYSVTARMREIGVRMSIGATQSSVMRMVLKEAIVIVGPGLLIGLPLALAVTQILKSQLYGVSSSDPTVIAGGIAFLTAAALAAAAIPARRASLIEPMDALRHE